MLPPLFEIPAPFKGYFESFGILPDGHLLEGLPVGFLWAVVVEEGV